MYRTNDFIMDYNPCNAMITGKLSYLFCLILIACASASTNISVDLEATNDNTVIVAHGDDWLFQGVDAALGATHGYWWLFGKYDGIYFQEFPVDNGAYAFIVSSDVVYSLDPGMYVMYLQYPGANTITEVEYNRLGEIGSPWRNIKNSSVKAYVPTVVQAYLDAFIANNPQLDDVWHKQYMVRVGDGWIKVHDLYETATGNLRIAGITNLAPGNIITAMMDEEQALGSDKERLYRQQCEVQGDDATQYRTWEMTFNKTTLPELAPGQHSISLHIPTGSVTTVPFNVLSRIIPPTPTPVIEYSYGILGDLIGVDYVSRYNETLAHWVEVTVTTTPKPRPEEVIDPASLNKRQVYQNDVVYIGERDLNILQCLGWPNQTTGTFYLAYYTSFESYPDTIIAVINPRHFNIDAATFGNYLGKWYMWAGTYDRDPPVAFIVRELPEQVTVPPTPTPTPEPTDTYAPVVTTTVSTMETTARWTTEPTTEAVNIPLEPAIALVAVLYLVARKNQ